MLSNQLAKAAVLICLLSMTACTDYLNGSKQKSEVIELSNNHMQCLKVLPEQMRQFSEGTSSEGDLNSGISCMQDALVYFQERTLGSVENGYSAKDMRTFFGKYFLKENNVSQELSLNLMRLKQVIIGGSDSYISKSEITHLVSLLEVLRKEVVLIHPHVRKLTFRLEVYNEAEINESLKIFRSSLHRLFQKTSIAHSGYSFNEAKSLFSGLSDFINGDRPVTLYRQASDILPVVESIKNILIGEEGRLDNSNDWIKAVDTIFDLYQLLLKSGYIFAQGDLVEAELLKKQTDIAAAFIRLIEESPRLKRDSYISFKDIDQLIVELNIRGWIPIKVSNKALQESYRTAVVRMLDVDRNGDSRGFYGVQLKHLKSLSRELGIFTLNQNFVNSVTTSPKNQKELLAEANKINPEDFVQSSNTKDVFEQKALIDSWKHFKFLLAQEHPMHFDSRGRVSVYSDVSVLKYDWASLTRFNVMNSLSRLLILGYSEKNSNNFSSLSLVRDLKSNVNGLASWYEDFNTLGVELKAFDPRSMTSGNRSFLEASLFTPSGDGNDSLNFVESFEFVSMLLSGGLGSSSIIQNELDLAGCQIAGTVDVFGFAKYKESCVRAEFKKKICKYFSNLPGMIGWLQMLEGSQFDDFFSDLIAVSRTSDPKDRMIELADIRTAVMILHYTETLMVLYDRDQNQGLDSVEIEAASDRFLSFLQSISPGTSDSNLKSAFGYLVLKGQKPSALDLISFKTKAFFVDSGSASRGQVLKVFRVLKEGLN